MSRFGSRSLEMDDNDPQSILYKKLEPWVNNPPDYTEMRTVYAKKGKLESSIIRLRRDIQRKEDEVSLEIDKPRSNEAKKAKLSATSALKDTLAELEAEFAEVESEVKALEFMAKMFNAATFRLRISETM